MLPNRFKECLFTILDRITDKDESNKFMKLILDLSCGTFTESQLCGFFDNSCFDVKYIKEDQYETIREMIYVTTWTKYDDNDYKYRCLYNGDVDVLLYHLDRGITFDYQKARSSINDGMRSAKIRFEKDAVKHREVLNNFDKIRRIIDIQAVKIF